jgi:hypothetical protein
MLGVHKMKTTKIYSTVTSTRPDLEVVARMPGAYVVKDGVPVPDLNDEAMKERETKNEKRETGNAEEKKVDTPSAAGKNVISSEVEK